ncbi:hypothetical protein EJ05DRAFT_462975 [Pseudovirgaria hyperparasitica]|uniref:DUF3500 domain-containing protein n=1 Tax=Pseudovirgaria hyperparasitica TaxID=470096 RepID=A0A6A6W9N0_9PEZI|nr:uncharacterized protein EJ05DRAFT_462975 [Pseudovirgaria hyperparasitica]KAF2759578.1 hypothetical protein EJ05DRAFT_462975 [Pseudovirgaria hyperparasitica]
MATNGAFHSTSAGFRQHLPDLTNPRFQIAKEQDADSYAEAFISKQNPPWLYKLTQAWQRLYEEPYKGITSDGQVVPDLYSIADENVPIEAIVAATNSLLSKLTPDEKARLSYPINAREWRAWSNPEMLLRPFGLRMEELSEPATTSILAILETTLSPAGYQKALAAMRINHFLGELVQLPKIMNQYSYNFLLFGTPSTTKGWGFLLYGHHLCLSVYLKRRQIFIAPTFTGAEPNIIDEGPWKGTAILHTEGDLGLELMQSLSSAQQTKAQTYKLLKDPMMKMTGDLCSDRWNKDDQRHLCGAFRDNRVVPYEGVKVSTLSPEQQSIVLDIAEQFLLYHPDESRKAKKELMKKHFDDTYFSWIGGYGDEDAYYFRLQSPVVIFEFDHHSGVFLNNEEPQKFHTHTIVRMPNQGDYGSATRDSDEIL